MPSHIHTLYAALVLSKKANARIKNIDIEEASKVAGFVSFVSYTDVPGSNQLDEFLPGEEVFVSSIALCVGAIIGIIVCESEHAAKLNLAASLVEIDYDLLSPRIFSIEDAIIHPSYFGDEISLQQGDLDDVFQNTEQILEDTLYIGGQEHFYMETNSFMVIPSNDDKEINIYTGRQNPTDTQEIIAFVLGRNVYHITCHVKRIGGAFSIPLCADVAVAAVKIARPIRLNLDRSVDMSISGHRHPFKIKYKVAFTNEGRFLGLDIQMWNNAGCTLDLSKSIMECAMLHMGNSYKFSNIRIRGRVCKTHLPSNTGLLQNLFQINKTFFFPNFRLPWLWWTEAVLACETIVENIAVYLKCDPFTIRCLNLFKEGDITHYGQILENWNVPRILNELKESSDFIQRQQNVEEFNQKNKYRKRGVSMIPVKFGIGFEIQHYNQAGAFVHVYKDGSVVISHGGVEIGQGLHTKMIAIVAEVLDCSVDQIRISETATDKIHNTTPTGTSTSSDLNGMAENLVKQAYFALIDLFARGFYITPNMFSADFTNNKVNYNYFTQGAADVGTLLNPQIDIGQIEGDFIQGVGLFTMEELIRGDKKFNKWIPSGQLYTCGVDTYKIPSFSDVPIDFRVSLLSNSLNPRAIYSSKGIGEPSILLAASAFVALKQACQVYREQQSLSGYFTLHSPATVERLRMACVDEFTRRVCPDEYETVLSRGSY
ncbi:unnamed protein product [Rotaria sp. Silwood1]|nr:unnamed protein product [Rotaria sp. Silwood1]